MGWAEHGKPAPQMTESATQMTPGCILEGSFSWIKGLLPMQGKD